jgi:peroxiredoxin
MILRKCTLCTIITLAAIIVIVVSYFAGCGVSPNSQSGSGKDITQSGALGSSRGTAVGQIAPDFTLSTLDGRTLSLEELRGKPVMLVFWTAWCPTCKEEAPKVNKIHDQYSPLGLQVIGINIGESNARIQEGVKDFGIRYTVAKDQTTAISKSYNVVGTPTVVIIDKSGAVRYYEHEVPHDPDSTIKPLLEG